MNKHCLALAVFGTLSSACLAQNNVQVYGIVDIGLAHENNGSSSQTRLDSGNVYGDRLGFTGTEDLGGGLAAVYNLETGYNLDTGTGQGQLFNRQSYAGLKTPYGTVTFGRQYTTLFRAQLVYDPFFTGFPGAALRLMSNGGGVNGSRMDNSVFYASPNINGFEGQLQYAPGEQANNASAGREFGGALGYAKGPVTVKLAYDKANNLTATNSTKITNLSSTYDFGVAKVFASYQVSKAEGLLDSRDALIGARVPFGRHTLLASYIRKDNRLTPNAGANQFGAGYMYALSKNTSLYAGMSVLSNDSGASIKVVKPGERDRLVSAGMFQKF